MGSEVLVEKFVSLQAEISVIAARGLDGAVAEYPPFENRHSNHILDVTTAPALVPRTVAARAREIARAILEAMDYVGVLCVEFFVTTDGELLVNELAPRPHNSGHLTFDAAVTSQFEQQVRAICGLPLGSTELLKPAAMANLLGDLWSEGEPNWAAACRFPDVKLHLYGKTQPRPGRKMGHLTATARTVAGGAGHRRRRAGCVVVIALGSRVPGSSLRRKHETGARNSDVVQCRQCVRPGSAAISPTRHAQGLDDAEGHDDEGVGGNARGEIRLQVDAAAAKFR